uniref:Putative product n=1 Tax=Xenopsylla cheopis TaxID=163159 RepID=A0A6M2E0R6_XENCH
MLELKFKFYSPRKWFGYYFLFATAQSWGMAFAWYWFADWNSWWFEYSMGVILGGTALAILCAGLYFAILKPREQIVIK